MSEKPGQHEFCHQILEEVAGGGGPQDWVVQGGF